VWQEYEKQRGEQGFSPEAVFQAANNADRLGAKVVQDGVGGLRGATGTPEQIRDYLRRFEECGVDQVIFISQAGKNRHEDIMESLELFGREVLPEFKDRADKIESDKAKRLAPVIEKVMARKPESDHPPLADGDYAFPAIPVAMAERSGNDQFFALLEDIGKRMARGEAPTILGSLG
jgi:hypothetical protein